jgi:GntR family transcriptional regulator
MLTRFSLPYILRQSISRDSPIPLYFQIVTHLRAEIATRSPGDRFHTEEELARLFEVSKMTVRQAVQQLVKEGLLRRVRGVGTFVGSPVIEQKLDQIREFLDQWFFQGRTVKVHIQAFTERPCPDDVAKTLQVVPREPILYVRRVRFADEVPLVLDHRFLPLAIGRRLTRDDLVEKTIHTTITEKLQIPVAGQQMEIWADHARPEEANALGIRRGDPVLVRTGTFFTPAGEPIWTGRSHFRSDRYRYSIYVPVKAETSSTGPGRRA